MSDSREDLAGTPPVGEYAHRLIVDVKNDATMGEVCDRLEGLRLDENVKYVVSVDDDERIEWFGAPPSPLSASELIDARFDLCGDGDEPIVDVVERRPDGSVSMLRSGSVVLRVGEDGMVDLHGEVRPCGENDSLNSWSVIDLALGRETGVIGPPQGGDRRACRCHRLLVADDPELELLEDYHMIDPTPGGRQESFAEYRLCVLREMVAVGELAHQMLEGRRGPVSFQEQEQA